MTDDAVHPQKGRLGQEAFGGSQSKHGTFREIHYVDSVTWSKVQKVETIRWACLLILLGEEQLEEDHSGSPLKLRWMT